MSKNQKPNHQSQKLLAIRHSCEHVLTQAMLRLYPDLKPAMGPPTNEGFYFDFDSDSKISENDFSKIEKEMTKIVKTNLLFKKEELVVKDARKLFKDNPYKQEWLDGIGQRGEKAIVYWTGQEFVDLCNGPHVNSTKEIGFFKLLSIAGAYWKGDEKNPMLTRIYGTCFPTQKELDDHLNLLEEAKKRDHRKIGKEQELFSFHPSAPGDVFWHPKGLIIFKQLYRYWQEVHLREDYQEVRTPEILTRQIWDQSGHTTFFIEKMYKVTTPDTQEWNMAIKPMNCDGGIVIYKSRPRSYKEFPLRMAEFGVVHRYESTGEIHGIIRPREFTQDDAHIYCTPDQVKNELKRIIDLCFEIYETFGLKLDRLELSTRPEQSIGSDEVWERAETIMRKVLKEKKTPYQINEGDGAFYGPKFDFHLKDALDRTWQCATIQLDFAQPENFKLEYITREGKRAQPVMIHRTLYGSVERFLGILIEHYAGAFPAWLSPVQAVIIPITDKQISYAQKVHQELVKENLRVELDVRSETTSYKIREAQLQKVPYMLVIGEREVKEKKIAVRLRNGKDLGVTTLKQFLTRIKEEVEEKK